MIYVEDGVTLDNPTHARIGWHDAIMSVEASSGNAGDALTYSTAARWVPSASPAVLTATIEPDETINYIAIGGHTLALTNIRLEVETGGAWEIVLETSPANNSAIMVLLGARGVVTRVRLTVFYAVGFEWPSAGRLLAGRVLTMQRPIYGGHSPDMLVRNTVTEPVNRGGVWAGVQLISQSRSVAYDWKHLKADWVRSFLSPFIEHARTRPFFVAWNPGVCNDCIYALADSDMRPTNMGIRNLMSVSLSARAYSDSQDIEEIAYIDILSLADVLTTPDILAV